MEEYTAMIIVRRKNKFHIDSADDLYGECHHLLRSVAHIVFWVDCYVTDVMFSVLFQSICSTAQWGDRTVAAATLLTLSMVVFGVMVPRLLDVCTRVLAKGKFRSPVLHLLFTL